MAEFTSGVKFLMANLGSVKKRQCHEISPREIAWWKDVTPFPGSPLSICNTGWNIRECTSVKVAPTTPSALLPCRINHEILGGGLSANQCTWRTTSSRNCFLPQEFVFFSQQNCFLPPELSAIFSSHIARFVQNGKCFEISSSRIIKSQQSLCEQI